MKQIDKRLAALEKTTAPARPNGRFTADLMLIYVSDEERAEWEAAGRPVCTKAEWEAALNLAYVNP